MFCPNCGYSEMKTTSLARTRTRIHMCPLCGYSETR
ncbi:putative RNA-binding Zn-ribbon protein involved in translation (DUF1610 family) [Arthrobacter bambusae]|uniref:RNA-binding Zn-ribbon protein involved in translation (DUF1610 family) n=1 Tax=Arthrobacter bambusae TaxID=1338426 RepID=A0AAW8DDW1_9MICC|nr:putative RNA-binding Zn-ribbon protein involved in translation (DUF1610 family) [Arthrobacter bambusae]MDQ0129509.1 putative RNA-binding Zn-ribbon protein involved in translation (DUF1610 family) [Arthrobacter bambusae]MDQ0180878.1 putative RNA-binding Zn-ribbon protein involved in translation (DUF1610 family) [Arthrobacter bambusae]